MTPILVSLALGSLVFFQFLSIKKLYTDKRALKKSLEKAKQNLEALSRLQGKAQKNQAKSQRRKKELSGTQDKDLRERANRLFQEGGDD